MWRYAGIIYKKYIYIFIDIYIYIYILEEGPHLETPSTWRTSWTNILNKCIYSIIFELWTRHRSAKFLKSRRTLDSTQKCTISEKSPNSGLEPVSLLLPRGLKILPNSPRRPKRHPHRTPCGLKILLNFLWRSRKNISHRTSQLGAWGFFLISVSIYISYLRRTFIMSDFSYNNDVLPGRRKITRMRLPEGG